MMKVFEKVTFDPDANAAYITMSTESIFSTEEKEDLIVDKDKNGKIVWIEILNATSHYPLIR